MKHLIVAGMRNDFVTGSLGAGEAEVNMDFQKNIYIGACL